jgi:hypothetical protein
MSHPIFVLSPLANLRRLSLPSLLHVLRKLPAWALLRYFLYTRRLEPPDYSTKPLETMTSLTLSAEVRQTSPLLPTGSLRASWSLHPLLGQRNIHDLFRTIFSLLAETQTVPSLTLPLPRLLWPHQTAALNLQLIFQLHLVRSRTPTLSLLVSRDTRNLLDHNTLLNPILDFKVLFPHSPRAPRKAYSTATNGTVLRHLA